MPLAFYRSPLRRIVLPLLRMLNPGDITIKHHWWPEASLRLDCYRHKGYWFHGRNRERTAMGKLEELVGPGDTVIDVGGHIGYVTLRLCGLVGPVGRVIVFEPGPNNLPYLRGNVAPYPNIKVVEAACSDVDGEAEFWIENLTGQNNTLVRDYKVWAANRDRAFSREALRPITVPTVRLDSFLARSELRPDLLKIDVEGAELMVLRGAERCLAECRPKLVVEVTENEREVDELLRTHHYTVLGRDRHELRRRRGRPPGCLWVCVPA